MTTFVPVDYKADLLPVYDPVIDDDIINVADWWLDLGCGD